MQKKKQNKTDMPTDWRWFLHISVQFTWPNKSHKQSFLVTNVIQILQWYKPFLGRTSLNTGFTSGIVTPVCLLKGSIARLAHDFVKTTNQT